MTAACSGSPPASTDQNCGFKAHYTTADNGATYYFRDCLIQSPTNGSAILVDTASTVKLYFTNCRIEQNATYVNYNGVQTFGAIGNGGSLHFIHDLFIHGPSLCSTSATQFGCMTGGVMLEAGNGLSDNQILYSEFDGLSDNIRADRPTDIEWNYLHDNYCPADGVSCPHGDPLEIYRGAQVTPVIVSNNYFSGPSWDSSAGLNLTDDFAANGNVTYSNNKVLGAGGDGWLLVIPQRTDPPPSDITNVRITNNTLFATTARAPDPTFNAPPNNFTPSPTYKYSLLTRFPGRTNVTVCDGAATGGTAWPNTCITQLSGNTWVNTAGTSAAWPF